MILNLDTTIVPPAPEMQLLFPTVVTGQADTDEQARFATLWQARVAEMLIGHADDPDLVQVEEWHAAA